MNVIPVFRHLRHAAFTLAELLIALGILGVIATFTIPKVLTSGTNGQYNAMAKEAAATISGAYQAYVNERGYNPNMKATELTPYLNYVSVYTGLVDDTQGDPDHDCSSNTYDCYKLHNGGVIIIPELPTFGGSTTLNAFPFKFDPDGRYGGNTDGPGKSVALFLYYNGRIVDRGNIPAGTLNSVTSYGAAPAKTPPWFSWN